MWHAQKWSRRIGHGSTANVFRTGSQGELVLKEFKSGKAYEDERKAMNAVSFDCKDTIWLVKDCWDMSLVYPYLGSTVEHISAKSEQRLSDCGMLEFLKQVGTFH
jgi:hypothetical protein